jgi:hypothetical protein
MFPSYRGGTDVLFENVVWMHQWHENYVRISSDRCKCQRRRRIEMRDTRAFVDKGHHCIALSYCWTSVGCWCDFLNADTIARNHHKGGQPQHRQRVSKGKRSAESRQDKRRRQRSEHASEYGRTWKRSRVSTQTPNVEKMERQTKRGYIDVNRGKSKLTTPRICP